MNIRGILAQLPRFQRRDIGKIAILARRCHVHIAVLLRFLDRLLRPFTGVDVVGDTAPAQKVHWHDGVLGNRSALQEQHLVILRNCQQFAQAGFSLRVNRDEFLASVTHFHDRHARSVPIQHLVARFFQNLLRQNRGPCTEIEYSPHFRLLRFLEVISRTAPGFRSLLRARLDRFVLDCPRLHPLRRDLLRYLRPALRRRLRCQRFFAIRPAFHPAPD